jgi:enoyl-CoA hydratase
MSDPVLLERSGPVAWLRLNRPDKLNALNHAIVDRLVEHLDAVAADDEVRVVVLAGAGERAFSSGFDLSEEADAAIEGADNWRELLAKDVGVTMKLWELPKPTIAAVRGWCLAGGCELAMACDMIVASEDARFGEPEIRYGSGPVTLLMPFLLGQKKTNELLFTGDAIPAADAERFGLVNRVVAADELEAAVEDLALRIAPTSPCCG